MPGSFLHLELDPLGLTAAIFEKKNNFSFLKDVCHVLYKDLPDSDVNHTTFETGMEIAAQTLDLKTCSTAMIFISPFSVSFRNISLPFSSEKKVAQVLPFEIETTLPQGKKNYISDFHMLPLEENNPLILTASVLESDIESFFSILEKYSIKPVMITHKGYAAATTFLKDHAEVTTCVFLHMAKTAFTLVLVADQKPCLVRVLSSSQISPEALMISIRRMIIGFEQRTGLELDFDIFVSLDRNKEDIDRFLETLKKSFTKQARIRVVEQGIPIEGMHGRTDDTLFLSGIVPDGKIKYLFNFCKGKFGSSSIFKTYSNHFAVALALLFLAFSLSIMSITVDILKFENKIAEIDNSAFSIFKNTFPETHKIQDPYLQMKANVNSAAKKSGADGNKGQLAKEVAMIELLNELSVRIDPSIDMEISRFLFADGQIVISGSTDNFNNVDKIKNKLDASDLFKKVIISSAAADKKEGRVDYKFIIEM